MEVENERLHNYGIRLNYKIDQLSQEMFGSITIVIKLMCLMCQIYKILQLT